MKLKALIKRNVKLFFKDKGLFFTSLITPIILIALYGAFLSGVYRDAFVSGFPDGVTIPEELLNGLVACQLMSSLLAVSCVTVSFSSNMLMVDDKTHRNRDDFTITPVKPFELALGYFISTLISTLLICFIGCAACFIYVGIEGWYISVKDVFLILLDIVILASFGTSLSSAIYYFLSTQGQVSAVGTMVSSCYGFICGAYMPLSNLSAGIQKIVSFLPGTYATSLLRDHCLRGCTNEMSKYIPENVIYDLRKAADCEISFFDTPVSESIKYAVLLASVVLFVSVFIAENFSKRKK